MRLFARRIVELINQNPRGAHLHPGARLHFAMNPPKWWWRTRSAPANRSVRSYQLLRLNFDLMTGFSPGAAADVFAARHAGRRLALDRILATDDDGAEAEAPVHAWIATFSSFS